MAAGKHTVRLVGDEQDATIDGYELAAARRALALLKGNLGRQRLLDLLQEEIAAGSAYMREQVQRSGGQERTGTTTLRAYGTTALQFVGWLGQAFGREDVLLAGHPEHYSIHAGNGPVNIVETLGDHVSSFFMRPWEAAASSSAQPAPSDDDGAVSRRRSHMLLEDGTVFGSIANSFHDEDDGFTAYLSVTLPTTCGAEVIEHHLEHFAVEFRTWILRAAAELNLGMGG